MSFLKADISEVNVSGDAGITPNGNMGIILFNANVNGANESNQSASVWLYMNTKEGANAGYTKTGISVFKIASLKHDFSSSIIDASLLGNSDSDTITINKGTFNKFSYKVLSV